MRLETPMSGVDCAGKEGGRLSETTGGSGVNRNCAIGVEGRGDVASYAGDRFFPLAFAHVLLVDQESVGRRVDSRKWRRKPGRQVQRLPR